MCVISCCLKLAISIVNSLLMIMGLFLMIVGALLLWGMNVILKGVYDLNSQIQQLLKQLNINADATGVISLIQQNSTSIGAIAFSLGVILVAISILGIIAVCCCSLKNILIVICIFLIVLTLGLIVLVLYFGVNTTTQVFDPLVLYLQKDIINKYQDINSTNPESIFVNVIQISASCCGLNNFSDFNTAPNFNKIAYDSSNTKYNISFPLSCCNYKQDFTISQPDRDACIKTGESNRKNIGCWNLVQPHLSKYLAYCFTSLGITIGILVATIVVTIILIKCADKIS